MTHDELLDSLNFVWSTDEPQLDKAERLRKALRAVVGLHKPKEQVTGMASTGQVLSTQTICVQCTEGLGAYATVYPCPTIQAIEKGLK